MPEEARTPARRKTRKKANNLTSPPPDASHPTVPTALTVLLIAAAVMTGLYLAIREINGFIHTSTTAVAQLGLVGAFAVGAGGLGSLLVLPLAGRNLDRGLATFTSVAAGFWLISLVVLALGSLGWEPVFTSWFWAALLGIGIGLALFQARRPLRSFNVPGRIAAGSLLWVIPAVLAGYWLAGAMRPPTLVGFSGDGYDVILYHLQVPREWILNGRVGVLDHNVYSYYPMGLESLYMVAMALGGGPWEGMYLAKMLHGLHGLLAVLAVRAALGNHSPVLARSAGILTACVPYLVVLGFTAMVELSQLFWLAMSLLWLRLWLTQPNWRNSLLLGLCVGGSCCVKYLSVGLVALPIALVLLIACVRRPRRLLPVGLAILSGIAVFAPWMVRNVAAAGNPVFPLATRLFGPGPFWQEDQQRWIAGHGPENLPPVPEPVASFEKASVQRLDRPARLYETFIDSTLLNPAMVGLAVVGLVAALRPRHVRRKGWFLPAVGLITAVQLTVWTFATHQMPARFFTPAAVCLALLGAGGLAMLARGWLALPAQAVLAAVAVAGAWMLVETAPKAQLRPGQYWPPMPPGELANMLNPAVYQVSDQVKPLLVGRGPAYYHPPGTMYATVFDSEHLLDWLGADLTPAGRLARLKQLGVTHIEVTWSEIHRLATTYGLPRVLADGAIRAAAAGQAPQIELIEQLKPLGLKQVGTPKPGITLYALPWAPAGTKG
jgi:4-amino-4-deoxy-L-arabinose transferase-like glycosyltransferase